MSKRHGSLLIGVLSAIFAAGAAWAAASPADEAAQAARQAAREDSHAQAIDNFQRAIAQAPERRREWLLELADQLTWAGRLDEAIALYREAALSSDADEQHRAQMGLARALSWAGRHDAAVREYDRVLAQRPHDKEARLDRAKVLAWANRHGAALAQYEAVLADVPGDREAARGAARVSSWRGRQRDAVARAEAVLAANPNDRETVITLAEAQSWMGRPDKAERTLSAHLAADPEHARAGDLLRDLRMARRPEIRADVRVYDQSDDLEIQETALGARMPFAASRGHVGARYGVTTFRPPSGPVEEIVVERPGIEGRFRFSDGFEWNGAVFVDRIDTRGAPGDHDPITYDTYLTYWPGDVLRFDIGASAWTFDGEEALRQGLTARQTSGSMDVTPDDRTRFSLRGSWADYSDGNTRAWWQLQADRRILSRPRLTLSYRYTGFDFSRPGRPGYYNPDLQHANEVVLHASGWVGETLSWSLRSGLGYEVEDPGDSRGTGSASAALGWRLQPRTDLEFAYDYSTSRAISDTGFERGVARVTLRRRF